MVFFGGAGTSTESNIPDFRSAGGLYQRGEFGGRAPEDLLSFSTLLNESELFFRYYRAHLLHPHAKPNRAHHVLAAWEKQGKLKAVITQNIDGLHQAAGSQTVLELHGSVHRNYCVECGRRAALAEVLDSPTTVPHCPVCGAMIRPDVVLFGEMLDDAVVEASIRAIRGADVLIIGGTSLVVYPAAGLIEYFRGDHLVLINRDPTPYDSRAGWVFRDSIGAVLAELAGDTINIGTDERA